MSRQVWRVALVGFGRMAAGYAADTAMAKHYPYAAHAQVLRDHPNLDWRLVVEPDSIAREAALSSWRVPGVVASLEELGEFASEIDIVVLATPPSARLGFVKCLPRLRAVLVEKPLGEDLAAANAFLNECTEREVLVQVNFWRRADRGLRALVNGGLKDLVGEPMSANCFYGNGLLNNGSHMVDMVRMLFGEVIDFCLLDRGRWPENGPISGDTNPTFSLQLSSGLIISFSPIDFRRYRENGMIIWGSDGRLDILNEGLVVRHYPVEPNRAMMGEREIVNDTGRDLESTVGDALYWMYDNLIDALETGQSSLLHSPASSALASTHLVDAISQAVVDGSLGLSTCR